eukprot:7036901-Pyramimonas_sp.AAC.1
MQEAWVYSRGGPIGHGKRGSTAGSSVGTVWIRLALNSNTSRPSASTVAPTMVVEAAASPLMTMVKNWCSRSAAPSKGSSSSCASKPRAVTTSRSYAVPRVFVFTCGRDWPG